MKDQRNALRKEVDGLRALREIDAKKIAASGKASADHKLAMSAELERRSQALDLAGTNAKKDQALLREAALRFNGMVFRGLEPGQGSRAIGR